MSAETSKFLSYVLRHAPESIGLDLDGEGWTDIDTLVRKANAAGQAIDQEMLLRTVRESEKKRFTLSEDGTRIRAAQGHSIKVNLGHAPSQPPAQLFHGTATRFLDAILAEGLRPGSRQHVHLSADQETATQVGARYGKPVVLSVNANRMVEGGHTFFQAENGVWLTDHVPAIFLTIIETPAVGGNRQ
ncbi:putative RNA 2'-phosphotransferase [Ciceribacter lividus]|uniref:Probable RNA 2'-phosphotransferase n=1 Tax=Ciceribacter lividus TaxID=1197950 RepID=A0A6I7HGL2_9HYPH|nr:RNA 2'-phosphotransferase [Ciceribacter lividus]RCW20024.1 putative RNA 2'-phosphotransferase [Ciceribacter lividus]